MTIKAVCVRYNQPGFATDLGMSEKQARRGVGLERKEERDVLIALIGCTGRDKQLALAVTAEGH